MKFVAKDEFTDDRVEVDDMAGSSKFLVGVIDGTGRNKMKMATLTREDAQRLWRELGTALGALA